MQWYRERSRSNLKAPELPVVHAGEHWQLQLELRSPRGRVNFSGLDAERWHFADGIDALAYVQPVENVRLAAPDRFSLIHWRELVKQRFESIAGH